MISEAGSIWGHLARYRIKTVNLGIRQTSVSIHVLSLTSCLTLNKSVIFFTKMLSHLKKMITSSQNIMSPEQCSRDVNSLIFCVPRVVFKENKSSIETGIQIASAKKLFWGMQHTPNIMENRTSVILGDRQR